LKEENRDESGDVAVGNSIPLFIILVAALEGREQR